MFSSTGFSPSTTGRPRPLRLTTRFLTLARHDSNGKKGPTTPRVQRLPAITHPWFSLIRFRSPLLTESLLFSLPVGTEMFHFPTFPPHTLYIQVQVTRHHSCWVSPFGHPRITARLTAPRGLSQPPTSFIGSWCQGIHRTLLHTYNKDARVHCAVLKQHTPLEPRQHHAHHRNDAVCLTSEQNRHSSREETLTCSLRTQQCIDITLFPASTRAGSNEENACQRSTHELPPDNMRVRNGLCLLPHTTV